MKLCKERDWAASKASCATRGAALLLVLLGGVFLAGCASKGKQANEPVWQRGWIGGDYKLAHVRRFFSPRDSVNAFPAELSRQQKAGVLVMRLDANAPAYSAGVRQGDVIVELNHRRVISLKQFRQQIEETAPGGFIPVRFWREGALHEGRICAGKEEYRRLRTLAVGLFAHGFNFGIDPGFSLSVLGYRLNPGQRVNLSAVDHEFARKCACGQYTPSQQDWSVWLGIIEVSKGKVILSQKPATSGTAL